VNEEIAETLRSIGIPDERLRIMPAFLPTPVLETPIPPRAYKWMTSHDPVISTTLSFRPEYGFNLLLSVFNRLRGKFPWLGCLVMGGGGEEEEAAEHRIRTLGLSDHAFLAGDVDHDLCLRLMSRSDLFVRPTFRDGDANSVREALAMGLPVVASRVGNRPEGVLLFEPGDEQGLAASIERGLRVRGVRQNLKPVDDYVGRLMALYT
jgi:glycosyltransferase involved in cell wall biosynthesis